MKQILVVMLSSLEGLLDLPNFGYVPTPEDRSPQRGTGSSLGLLDMVDHDEAIIVC